MAMALAMAMAMAMAVEGFNMTKTLEPKKWQDDVVSIEGIIESIQSRIDNAEWEGVSPEDLKKEYKDLKYYRERLEAGVLYEPKF